MNVEARKRGTAIVLVAVIGGMLGLTAASVPLYRLFCQVTGYGGTTQRAEQPVGGATAGDRTVTVLFNADTGRDLPWGFRPLQRRMEVKLGEQNLAFFEAVNRADYPVAGQAVYNVTPFKIGGYFAKIQCFCFDEQTLAPGERVEMPVSFYVDPEIAQDPNTDDVSEITLSYTFYIDEDATKELRSRTAAAPAGAPKADPVRAATNG
jgi:cytochrome c oxidase assembly protein subunit 11